MAGLVANGTNTEVAGTTRHVAQPGIILLVWRTLQHAAHAPSVALLGHRCWQPRLGLGARERKVVPRPCLRTLAPAHGSVACKALAALRVAQRSIALVGPSASAGHQPNPARVRLSAAVSRSRKRRTQEHCNNKHLRLGAGPALYAGPFHIDPSKQLLVSHCQFHNGSFSLAVSHCDTVSFTLLVSHWSILLAIDWHFQTFSFTLDLDKTNDRYFHTPSFTLGKTIF